MKKAIIWVAVSSQAQASEDKASLEMQETNALAFCEQNSFQVVDILRVNGHSRRYTDWEQLKRDARSSNPPIDAFDRLEMHWQAQDFDILIVRDGDRFARTQTLHAKITEDTINSGAIIYSFADGYVDGNNYRMWISMVGYRSATEMDSLRQKYQIGMTNRAKRGLSLGTPPPRCHLLIRDHVGKPVRLEPNEQVRVELERAVRHLLAGDASLNSITPFMVDTYKYPFTSKRHYYRIFMNPIFWGHTGIRYGRKYGVWRLESGHDDVLPDDTDMYYDTHQPFLENPLHDEFLAYMRIQSELRGKGQHTNNRRRYAGLIICQDCGRYRKGMTVKTKYKIYRYWSCSHDERHFKCTADKLTILETTIDKFIDNALNVMVESSDISAIRQESVTPIDVNMLDAEIQQLQLQLNNLIQQSSKFSGTAFEHFESRINQLADQIDTLKLHRHQAVQDTEQQQRHVEDYQQAIENLKQMSVMGFWQLPVIEQHRLLHRMFGNRRLVVKNDEIVGTTNKPKFSRNYI